MNIGSFPGVTHVGVLMNLMSSVAVNINCTRALYIINTMRIDPAAFMSSPGSSLLSSLHCDGLERDDENIWTQYVSIAADTDKQMIDEWMKLVDTILVFVGFFTPVSRANMGGSMDSWMRMIVHPTLSSAVQIG